MPKVVIIGGGEGGRALLPILVEDREIDVVGIADIRSDAPGIEKAKELGIPTFRDYNELLARVDTDVIVNVTGSEEVSRDLQRKRKKGVEILEGLSARLLFNLVDERKKREQEIIQRLKEHQMLYEIGLLLTSSEYEEEILTTIVKHAMKLTDAPAGSIALYNETDGAMEMVTSIGFSENFSRNRKWKLRKGGLTDHILNQNSTVVISDIRKLEGPYNPALEKEGIRSIMATPLVAERKTIGILYVDDFNIREFTEKDASILALLATQAAAAIERVQILEKTKKLAMTDELTSLNNHRHFVNLMREEMKRAMRYNRPMSVMLIDIDNFKHYNDTHGHLRGNEVLKGVSGAMRESIRNIDILARFGGEEFSVILPETDGTEAVKCAERIRKAVEKTPFYGEKRQPLGRLTVSIGVAAFPDDAKSESTLLDRADKALYRAKREGKNRVVAYGGS